MNNNNNNNKNDKDIVYVGYDLFPGDFFTYRTAINEKFICFYINDFDNKNLVEVVAFNFLTKKFNIMTIQSSYLNDSFYFGDAILIKNKIKK